MKEEGPVYPRTAERQQREEEVSEEEPEEESWLVPASVTSTLFASASASAEPEPGDHPLELSVWLLSRLVAVALRFADEVRQRQADREEKFA